MIYNFSSPEEASPPSLVGEFYIRTEKPRLQRVQEATSFPPKWPHTGTCFSPSLSLSMCLPVCPTNCLSLQIGRVDCIADSELCQSLYIHNPCVAVFKGLGIHDFEIHHGEYYTLFIRVLIPFCAPLFFVAIWMAVSASLFVHLFWPDWNLFENCWMDCHEIASSWGSHLWFRVKYLVSSGVEFDNHP